MPYDVTIDEQVTFIIAGSLIVDGTIGKRSTASFVARTTTATHFQQHQQVAIYDQNNSLAFSGYIDVPKEQKPGYRPSLIHTISCIDQHWLADKRIVAASFVGKSCGFIAQYLFNTILSQEGVTIGLIYDGLIPSDTLYPSPTLYPTGNVSAIPSATFVYCTVAQAFDALVKEASASGIPYYWQIDQFKQLWFCPYTSVVNSTVVDGSQIDMVNNPPTVQRQNPTYRNVQYVVGGVATTLPQVETRVGDGHTQAWTMGYEISATPTVTVGGVAKKVGVKGSTGSDFYWGPKDTILVQDSAGTVLTSSNVLSVSYIGQYPTVLVTQNGAQISYQKALDGTTGLVETVENDTSITSLANGLSLASQLLTRYGVQGTLLQFTTMQSGYAQGQLITVNLQMFNLNNAQMLIEEVSASDQQDNFNIWYTIKAVMGPYDTTWQDFYSKMLAQQAPASAINAGVSQTLLLFHSLNVTLTPTITMRAATYSCPVPSSTLYPSAGLYPC
jgi:hypothetical protein